MKISRPISDFGNNFLQMSDLCHSSNEPIFITHQGTHDMVLMEYPIIRKTAGRA